MLPAFLPVGVQPAQTQPEDARSQIGITLAFGQDKKAAVVDDKREAAGALAWIPRDPFFARFEVERSGGESDEGDPLALQFSHVAQGLAGQHPIVQVMLFGRGAGQTQAAHAQGAGGP